MPELERLKRQAEVERLAMKPLVMHPGPLICHFSVPPVFLIPSPPTDPEDLEQFRKDWEALHNGPDTSKAELLREETRPMPPEEPSREADTEDRELTAEERKAIGEAWVRQNTKTIVVEGKPVPTKELEDKFLNGE